MDACSHVWLNKQLVCKVFLFKVFLFLAKQKTFTLMFPCFLWSSHTGSPDPKRWWRMFANAQQNCKNSGEKFLTNSNAPVTGMCACALIKSPGLRWGRETRSGKKVGRCCHSTCHHRLWFYLFTRHRTGRVCHLYSSHRCVALYRVVQCHFTKSFKRQAAALCDS